MESGHTVVETVIETLTIDVKTGLGLEVEEPTPVGEPEAGPTGGFEPAPTV